VTVDQHSSSTEEFEVAIVGAGFAGIGAAVAFRKMGYTRIVILDREDDLGGTWHVNRYPGLAVDIPSPTYSYWFEPNPGWSRLYAPGDEVRRYAHHVADKYDVRRHMRFSTTVEGARWDEDTKLWQVAIKGAAMPLSARFLVTATGFLSQPCTPDIPGITEFAGRIVHSAAWDDSCELEGRRVAIIGTGATAVQLVPELAKVAADVTVYQRTPIHVVPKVDFAIPTAVRRLFGRIPFMYRMVRWFSDTTLEMMMVLAVLNFRHFRFLNATAAALSAVWRFLTIRDRALRRKLAPDYDFGCKRPTYSNSYYRAFTKTHVHLQSAGIERVEPDGIVAADGTKTVIDTLVLATGFDLWQANMPAIEIVGREGRDLGKWWRDNGFNAYQGLTVPYFPNLLSLASPYASSGLSFFSTMEYQMRHISRLFGEVRRRGATTFEVTEEAHSQFGSRMDKMRDNTVLGRGNCASSRSYYFSPTGETLLRPASTYQTMTEQSRFALSDYAIS
jgi:cation diffusion facilitator CzcD-associated flavoprotein CzcO